MKTTKGGPWHVIAWGTARNSDPGGVMIILNMRTFSGSDIRERLDPPPGLTGRIGGLHLKRRTQEGRQGFDLVLSVGYAFQNTDDEERRHKFWDHLQRIHTNGGARTQHLSAIDGNAHVMSERMRPRTVFR